MKKFKIILLSSTILILIFSSCRKDKFSTNGSLQFSTDTVMFDTVFNGIGSATRYFIVYNKNNLPILVSDIQTFKGSNSKFRLNINGTAGNSAKDIEIAANDSIFIFVDVKINTQTDDILEEDQIIFNTNNNKQIVNLTAFGKDVHLLKDSIINSQTWTNDKPYLIINSVVLNKNQTLNIEEGTHIYSHRNSRILILGTLNVNGTYENPVIFEADRLNGHSTIFTNDTLDNYYDVAGQWSGIWLTKFSTNNLINFAEIKNAIIGIQVDSIGDENYTQLRIHNSKIEHHSFAGIFTQQSSIFATNCLITDCGYYDIAFTRGGNYEFYHSTIGNYWKSVRQSPAVYMNNFYETNETVYIYPLVNAYFGNCIIWGNNETEIGIKKHEAGDIFNYMFDNSIVKVDSESEINTSDTEHFKNALINKDPLFIDYSLYDFMIEETSPARNTGNIEIINLYPSFLNTDLNNVSRVSDDAPDIGAYEFL